MKIVIGIPGTVSGLLLRIGQCLFAGTSIGVMIAALGFANYTTFCYLIVSMGLQLIWSLGLACIDIYALWTKRDLRSSILVGFFVVGDWVTATLSFAAACSSTGVVFFFGRDFNVCRTNLQLACVRYETSIALAFVAWLLIALSSLILFSLLASA